LPALPNTVNRSGIGPPDSSGSKPLDPHGRQVISLGRCRALRCMAIKARDCAHYIRCS
ncbi:uncharacterized protein PgNI_01704, partial [Pyricularia grisea]|uniref:Uncharacterized protein n=1 Tax=Pyricularia grisea TaxID=148305 RepID=A0A6P8BIF1_PYRGI